MSHTIVCATRGGEGSRAVQMAAIQQAKERGNRLIFLYITDVTSLSNVDDSLLAALRHELNWMGRTLLSIARRRANLAGLDTDVVIRMGNVRDEIEAFLRETQAEELFLGAPRGTTANVFGDDAIEKFAHTIESDTQVPVTVIRPEFNPVTP